MNNLFLGLSLLFLVIFVVGLVKPSVLKLESRKRVAVVCGSMIVVFFVLFGITSPSTPATSATATVEAAPFNVPPLLGKNIDEIAVTLGVANKDNSELTEQQMQLGATEWSKAWEKDGQELLVTYDSKTRVVIDFFLSTTDPAGVTTDTQSLLKAGNLNKNDPAYQVEFVKALKGSGYTGVKVTAK